MNFKIKKLVFILIFILNIILNNNAFADATVVALIDGKTMPANVVAMLNRTGDNVSVSNKKIAVIKIKLHKDVYKDLRNSGLSEKVINQIMGIYNKEIKHSISSVNHPTIEIVLEQNFDKKSKYISDGNVLHLTYTDSKHNMDFYYYIDKNGNGRYHNVMQGFHISHPLKNSRITSDFGYRNHPIYNRVILHKGIDYAAAIGIPIYAAADGKISKAFFSQSYGNRVVINHKNGYASTYSHLNKFVVKSGVSVKKGQLIGYAGKTGNVTGAHLHFEIMYKDKPINPTQLLKRSVITSTVNDPEFTRFVNYIDGLKSQANKQFKMVA